MDFTYPNETAVNSVPKSLIHYVTFSSGRKEEFTRLINIDGPNGWRNVLISNNFDDIVGLIRLGEINTKVLNMYGLLNNTDVEAKASERIKRAASDLGAHMVLTKQNYTRLSSFKTGVAYEYPFKNTPIITPTVGESAKRYYVLRKASGNNAEPAVLEGQQVVFDVDGFFT